MAVVTGSDPQARRRRSVVVLLALALLVYALLFWALCKMANSAPWWESL